jgi:chromosome segregation ATPase
LQERVMTLTDFFHEVGCQFQDLFWRDAPRQELEREVDELKLQIRQQTAILLAQQGVIDDARRRLTDLENRTAGLSARIEVYHHLGDQVNAWKQALELDRLTRRIPRVRRQLQEFRAARCRQHIRVQELRDQLVDLQAAAYANR